MRAVALAGLISVPYWRRQLRGDLGRLALEPHIMATRTTELPVLASGARALTPGAHRFHAALSAAGFPD